LLSVSLCVFVPLGGALTVAVGEWQCGGLWW
jgi:hypothetical protein